MAGFGQEISYDEGLREQEEAFRPVNPLSDPLMGLELNESANLAKEVQENSPELSNPKTAWFETGPFESDPSYKQAEDDFERVYARAYHIRKPKNLAEYIAMGDMLVQTNPGMTNFIKRRMQNMPTGAIKDEYVENLQEAKAKRQFVKSIEMDAFRRQTLKARGIPDPADAKAEADSRKADAAERKVRSEMRKDLGVIDNSINNMKWDIDKAVKDGKTAEAERMKGQLSRMQRDKQDIYRDLGWTDDTPPDDTPPYDGISPEKFRNLPMDELFAAGDEARSANDARYAAEDGAAGDESTPSASAPRMDARDQDMLRWAIANPSDLKAQRVLQVIQSKYRIQ